MAHAIRVMVVDKNTGKGKSGYKVKNYGGSVIKTDKDGFATIIESKSSTNVYVEGFEVYKGTCSAAPNPIIVRK